MEIDGASHTGVAEVRDLQESIGYVPSQFSNKVYVIDEVHMLSMHAFNALLKTLEEPPPHVYFIFATTAPHKIPDTIKSRCQRHQFKRLEVEEIAGQLEAICKAEKIKWEPEALRLLGRKAEGSMRDGESLLDQVITASSGDVKTTSVRQILGLLDQEMIDRFLSSVGNRDATTVLKELDGAVQEGVDLEELTNALIEGFRDLMLLASPGDLSELIYRSKDETEALKEHLNSFSLGDLVTIVERLCNVVPRLKMASDPRILMESVLVDLALIDRQIEIRKLIDTLEGSGSTKSGGRATQNARIEKPRTETKTTAPSVGSHARVVDDDDPFAKPTKRAEKRGTGEHNASGDVAATDAPKSAPTPPPSAKDVDLSSLEYADLRRLWGGFVTYVRQKKVALGVCLISGTLKSFDEKRIVIRYSKGFSFQKDQVETAGNRDFLHGMLTRYFGRDIDLVCVSESESAPIAERPGAADPDGTSQRPIETKPIVKKILSDFDGEIVRYHPQ